MKAHELAKELLEMGDLPVVHPGQGGDIYIEYTYYDPREEVIVVVDEDDTGGSETGRHHKAVMLERERCLQLVEARIRRLEECLGNYPPQHSNYSSTRASIENLKTMVHWIAGGISPEQTVGRNPGGIHP